ncbi:MAG: hypothetical protein HYR85_21165 [Planctomycetes bacterium]|nr:hypothetical protein [Planctomycetota bacterium]MBI3843283.1 hypothetical protein [Planctomycetota bacterium]
MKVCIVCFREPGVCFGIDVWRRTIRFGLEAHGILAPVIDPREVQLRDARGGLSVWRQNELLTGFNLVFNLLPDAAEPHGALVVESLIVPRGTIVNPPVARIKTSCRVRMLGSLRSAGIPIPRSVSVASAKGLTDAIDFCGGLPVLLKTLRGARGVGVTICESLRGARSVAQLLLARDRALILQEYLAYSGGADLKILASRRRVLCAVERRATARDEFRANVSLGATSRIVAVDDTVQELAVRAVTALGLIVGSADVIQNGGNAQVIEVNDLPELNLTIDGRSIVEPEFARYFVRHLLEDSAQEQGLAMSPTAHVVDGRWTRMAPEASDATTNILDAPGRSAE